MKKLKLNLEDLKVDSFETSKEGQAKGTAYGNGPPTASPVTNCQGATCHGANTCEISCELATCPLIHCDPSNETCTGYCWWVCGLD